MHLYCMLSNPADSQLPAALQRFTLFVNDSGEADEPLYSGACCPHCGEGVLDYDGLLQLVCASCGFRAGSGGGCT